MRIRVLNGPNLNLLGSREPSVYGKSTYDDLVAYCYDQARQFNCDVEVFQTNHEGQLLDWIHESHLYDALVINPGAWSHYSIAILDALLAVNKPSIEVHLSQVYQREDFRKAMVTAQGAKGVITGLGLKGYALAMEALVSLAINN